MPFNTNKDLPAAIQKLPDKAQTIFRKAFNQSYSKYGEDKAFQIAWTIVKKKFKKVNNEWVAHGMGYEVYKFELDTNSEEFVQHAEDGNYYITGVLADTLPVSDGWSFTEDALQDFANQINQGGIFGGITHAEYQDLIMKYSHLPADEFVAHARSERKGILKTMKAVYEKGKLWIKAIVDKRYLNHIQKFGKMSIEAWIPKSKQQNGKYLAGKVLGFALDNRAKNQRTSVQLN